MRLIDADVLYELLDGGYDLDFDEVPETKAELLRMISQQPTIDAVEVVRCEDCVAFYDVDKNPPHIMCGCMSDNGYCNYGKRGEE